MNQMNACCAECGADGGIRLKICKSCMSVKYCNAICQKNHWPKHKKECKLRAAELRDEALFKDPPPKEDCPICFLPIPEKLINCVSLRPATRSSVPIQDFADEHVELAQREMETYYPCCGKSACGGCLHSFYMSGNMKCPFCNADGDSKTEEERVQEMMRRVEANDPASICMLATHYHLGRAGFQQDHAKAIELYARAAELGFSKAHYSLGMHYKKMGDLKKAKFHFEVAAMVGHDGARYNLGSLEADSGNLERAVKHWTIAASAGHYNAMYTLLVLFKKGQQGGVSRDSINTTLAAYNKSCAEMRSESRDAFIRFMVGSEINLKKY
jgi:tetratricopeptide (TPR) repeat protein